MTSKANRHTIEEILKWCDELELLVERQVIANAGIIIIEKKNE